MKKRTPPITTETNAVPGPGVEARAPCAMHGVLPLLRKDCAEILILDEDVSVHNEYAQFHYSFCMLEGELNSLNVQYRTLSHYRGRDIIWPFNTIFHNRYVRTDQGFDLIEREAIGPGGDPRVVSDGKNAYAIIVGDLPGNGPKALVYDLRRRRKFPVKVDDMSFHWGKNWQPFLDGDELYVVHEFTPLRVMRIDLETGCATATRTKDVALNMPCCFYGSPQYPALRGGGNAILQNGTLYGIGRATSSGYRHAPFAWSIDGSGRAEFTFSELFSDFYGCGINLIDPTSLFFVGDDLYLGLCCTERDWVHSQRIINMLVAFRRNGAKDGPRRLDRFLARRSSEHGKNVAMLHGGLFFCVEMPGEISYVQEHSGKLSVGDPGQLVGGPGVEIIREDLYCAELSYLTLECKGARAGVFEIAAMRVSDGEAGTETRVLGRADIPSTDREMNALRVAFDTSGLIGWKLETRVFAEEGVKLNAFHVRTWFADGNARP